MKIIALQASPRVGGNCDILMDEMIKGAEENGVEVTKYYLEKSEIAPCIIEIIEKPKDVDSGMALHHQYLAKQDVLQVLHSKGKQHQRLQQ